MNIHSTAEQKRKAEALHGLHKKLILTFDVLDSDLKFAEEEWTKNQSSQFWRRTLVRCFCAWVEGILSLLKGVTPDIANYFKVTLTAKDFEVVTELRKDKKTGLTKTSYLPIRDNLKETFKVYAKAHAIQAEPKYDDPRFDDLENTFKLRHKLMHPKKLFDLEVSDNALEAAFRGDKWFGVVLDKVMTECRKQRPFPPK
jgi:hypothetical protein